MEPGELLETAVKNMPMLDMNPPIAGDHIQEGSGPAQDGFSQVSLRMNVMVPMYIIDLIGTLREKFLNAFNN